VGRDPYTAAGTSGDERTEQRNLVSAGLRVSAIGLGCSNFGGRTDFGTTQKVIAIWLIC
jgi:hypothetical protein